MVKEMIKQTIRNVNDEYAGKSTPALVATYAKADYNLSESTVKDGLIQLISSGEVIVTPEGNYKIKSPINNFSNNRTIEGDNMNVQKTTTTKVTRPMKSSKKVISCTPEQAKFARDVQKNKSKLFDAADEGMKLIHRGIEIKFGGAGESSLRYLIAVAGMSDKDEIEEVPMFLDWDDTALYEEGGIADQIREFLGQTTEPKVQLKPMISVGAK
ncbi:MAG: hypothetical protein Q4Q18_09780 [Methanobrevibacter sp.]|nr:hypothetical protein [Methanobrevibacter sp.]